MSRNEGITQKEIIDKLLTEGLLKETELRGSVKKTMKLTDDSSIRRHIKILKELGCITQIKTPPGSTNEWDISTPDNLKHIKKTFPEIDVKQYEKSHIIACSRCFELNTERGILGEELFAFFKQTLKESESLFWACVENDISTLYKRWVHMFAVDYMLDERYRHYAWLHTAGIQKNPSHHDIVTSAIEHYIKQDIANGVAPQSEIHRAFERNIKLRKVLDRLQGEAEAEKKA